MIHTIDVALSQLDITEATGHNDGVPAERYMQGDELPWCAGFVLWCNRESDDDKIATSRRLMVQLRSVNALEARMKTMERYVSRQDAVPERNWVVFFQKRGESDPGTGRHVGIVESVTDTHIHTVEGNSGNRVCRRSYRRDDPYITGYGRQSSD